MYHSRIRRTSIRGLRHLTVGAAVLVTTAACSSSSKPNTSAAGASPKDQAVFDAVQKVIPGISQQLVQKACDEGQVQIYQIAVTPSVTTIDANFKKLVPCVTMNVVQAAGGELAQRFDAGQSTGNVPDYYEQSDPGLLEKAANSGLLLNYTPTSAKNISSPNPGLWYPEYGIAMGFAYRSDKISDVQAAHLTKWSDITSPEFANVQAAVVSPAAGGTALTSFYHMYTSAGGTLRPFAPKKSQVFDTSRPAGEALTSGESDIAFPFAATTALQLLGTGAPVHIVFPTPTDVIYIGGGVSAKAKDPAAAELFEEYMLSPEAQTTFASENGALPANTSVKFSNSVTSQSWWRLPTNIYKYEPSAVTSQSAAVLAAFKSAFGG